MANGQLTAFNLNANHLLCVSKLSENSVLGYAYSRAFFVS
jgi:hypothetical protein